MKKLLLLIISIFILASFVQGQCPSTNNLTTFYGNNNGQDGIMFDVSASATSNTIIKCFDSNFNAGTFDVEIYYKVGTHVGFEVNAAAWTLAGTANGVVSTGVDVATYIPLVLNLTIPCSETYAFYITSTTGGMKYTNGTGVGNVLASNASLTIYEGTGKDYAYGMNFTPRQFNGTVYYDVTGSCGGCIVTVNNPTICSGGTATITANSTVVGTTYLWNTGATTNPLTVSPGATTTYTVTGTTPISQTCSASATVTVNPTPVITTSATSTSICLGVSTTITASSSVVGTTYNWSTGSTTNPITVSPGATTTYTVTGTTISGCTGTASVTVTVNPNPTITATASPTAICVGSSSTISATSSVGGTSYLWNTGATTNPLTVSPGATTTYTVTGTTASGCTGTASVTVTVNPNPTITASASPTAICVGSSSTITANSTVVGTSYLWNTGATTNPLTVSPGATTTYTVTGTTASGCTGTASVTVTVNPNPTITTSASPTAICVGSSSTLSATSSVSGTTYNWSTGSTTNPLSVSPLSTTTYTVTGTTASGCTGTASVTVTVNANLSPTITAAPSSICEGNSTSLTAGNVPVGSTYNWSTGSTLNPLSVTPAATTSYQVTATDGNGCTGTATVSVTVNTNPVISPTATPSAICLGTSSTISATTSVGGTTYSWDQGLGAGTSHIVSPTVTTTYTVTGTTANACTGTATVSVTVNPNPVISAVANPDSICLGSNSTLTASSSIVSTSYTWSNGATTTNTQSVSPTINTTYTVTGTSASGCTGTATVSVYLKPDILPVITANPSAICLGDSTDISISNIPNGTSFLWSNSSTTNPLTVIPSTTTTYVVTATTIGGCTGTTNIQITVNPLPQIQVNNDTICNGDIGSLLASGASTYLWNNSTTVNPLTDNPSVTTIYTVIGTDVNGCSSTGQGEIYVIDPPTLVLSSTDAHCNQNDGSVTVVASGGTGVYTYSWNTTPVSTTSSVNNVPPGTYSVTVTDNGCASVTSVNVGNISGPTAAFIADPTEANINEDIIFTDLSIGAISWYWSFGDGMTSILQHPTHAYSSQGIYDVWLYIEDYYGCTDSTTSRIIINQLFTIYIPNAFSPDGNGVNEIFIPSGMGIDEERYVMQIYDRWGNRVFETTDIGIGWDGSLEGQLVEDNDKMSAVFVYYIKLYEEGTDVNHEYRGTITLLK